MYTLIEDIEELKMFHSFLHPLQTGEAYFVSMSARNKYLSVEEREYYSLRKAEMFSRKLVKDSSFESFLRVLRTMEVNQGGYTTANGKCIPEKCLSVYANINASSGLKAYKEFNTKMNDLLMDSISNQDGLKSFASLDTILMNCFQRQQGTKYLLDIDFDIPKELRDEFLFPFVNILNENNVIYKVLETHGGFHVLIVRKTIGFNYTKILNELNLKAKQLNPKYEILKNVNDMVPIAGVLQAGFPVSFVELK